MSNPSENKKTNIILAALGVIPVVWAALMVAPFLSDGLAGIIEGFTSGMADPMKVKWCVDSLKAILIFLLIYGLGIGVYLSTKRNYRKGEEHGSAKWGNASQLSKKYADKNRYENIILTQNTRIGLDGRKHRRNLNVLVCGGSGAGKTRFYAKPNIMQANTSFVVLDPKGEILRDTGFMLEKEGYEIRVLDLINTERSHGYNPFVYLRDDKDVLKLVANLVRNTTPKGAQSNDPFWERAETALLEALILYLVNEAPPEEQNFPMVMEMISAAEVKEEDEGYTSILDELFNALEQRNPEHLALKQYRIFKMAAGKTAKSILISCGARLAPFDIAELRELMSYDEMELDTIGDRKTALFVIISDTDDTFNFVVAIMYSQLFNLLCDKADDVYNGRLPVHVRCLLDEFANIGQIPKFDKLIATIRSREISASIILQSQSQLKTIYKDAADTITGNCDCTLFLGGKEKSTLKEISEVLGKETIDLYNTSETRSNNNSYGLNYQKTGKELMSQDEIAVMDGAKCILQLRGVRPFLSNKYDITKHPKYRQLSDYDKRNTFDIEKYRKHKLVVKPDDTFDLYDMGEVEAD